MIINLKKYITNTRHSIGKCEKFLPHFLSTTFKIDVFAASAYLVNPSLLVLQFAFHSFCLAYAFGETPKYENSKLQASDLLVFLTPAFMLVILTARMLTGAMVPTVWMESAWLVGQVLTTLLSFIIQRILPAFILTAGTMILTLILRLLVLTWTAAYLTDVC